jgi:hypothetical protein
MVRAPRREEHTICTAIAPEGSLHRADVGHQSRLRAPVSTQIRQSSSANLQASALHRRGSDPGVIEVRTSRSTSTQPDRRDDRVVGQANLILSLLVRPLLRRLVVLPLALVPDQDGRRRTARWRLAAESRRPGWSW